MTQCLCKCLQNNNKVQCVFYQERLTWINMWLARQGYSHDNRKVNRERHSLMHSQQGTEAGLWNMRLHPCLKGWGSASLFFSCVSGICAEGMGRVNRAQSCDTRGSPLCQMNEKLKRWEDTCLHLVIMCVLICHCLCFTFFILFAPGPRKNPTSVSYF